MQEAARSSRASSTGMTAKVAARPASVVEAGSIPAVSTVLRPDGAAHLGIEEDGNLPDSDSGETRFDSAGPDRDVV
jgi:hypothetical protein